MKSHRLAVAVAALIVAITCPVSYAPVAAESLNWDHRAELFWRGTITDAQGKVWDVVFIPGFSNVSEDAGEQWGESGSTVRELGTQQFWSNRRQDAKDGLDFAKDSFTKYWYDGITDDFHETVKQNSSIQPGEFGSVFMPFANWMFYTGDVLFRTATAPLGAAGGLVYSVVWPTGHVIERPIEAGMRAAVRGTVSPGMLYVWNGFAWVGTTVTTLTSNVPARDSYFVHLHTGGRKKHGEFVIDRTLFERVLQASVKQVMTREETAAIDRQVKAISAELDAMSKPYRHKQQELHDAKRDVEESLQKDQAYSLLNDAIGKARSRKTITLEPDAKQVYLDHAQLKATIAAYLQSQGMDEPTGEMVQQIVQQLNQNLTTMGVSMESHATDEAAAPQPVTP
ncbi:MAG: hypothetical protein OEV08_16360 [Nitrospira sp.]|nr:hypothetical protein [Nitrospira sp.]